MERVCGSFTKPDLESVSRERKLPGCEGVAPIGGRVTFSAKIAHNLIDYAARQGADASELRAILGLSSEYRDREDVRIPALTMSAIWSRAIELTGDHAVGFHMVAQHSAPALRTTSLIMQSANTVRDALRKGIDYSALIANAMDMELGETDGSLYVEFIPRDEWTLEPAAVVADCLATTYASMLLTMQQITGGAIVPSLLWFSGPRPDHVQYYYKVFACRMQFDQGANRIGFPASIGEAAIATRDASLLSVLQRYADELTSTIDQPPTTAARIRDLVLREMNPAPPTIDRVASLLDTSPRSLQRKLAAENGPSFSSIVDEVRRSLCDRYLDDPSLTVDELAYLTGYADTASFIRAHKRWHGTTPRQLSARNRA